MGAQTMIKKRDTKSHATQRASKSKKRKISPGEASRLDTTDDTFEKQEPTGWEAIESTDRAEKEHGTLILAEARLSLLFFFLLLFCSALLSMTLLAMYMAPDTMICNGSWSLYK